MFSPISFFLFYFFFVFLRLFLYRLSLIQRFIGKLSFLLSATFFCLSFNFPIFSAKQARGEIDVIPSILCLIGFPSFRGNFAVFLFFLDLFLFVRRIFRVSLWYLSSYLDFVMTTPVKYVCMSCRLNRFIDAF